MGHVSGKGSGYYGCLGAARGRSCPLNLQVEKPLAIRDSGPDCEGPKAFRSCGFWQPGQDFMLTLPHQPRATLAAEVIASWPMRERLPVAFDEAFTYGSPQRDTPTVVPVQDDVPADAAGAVERQEPMPQPTRTPTTNMTKLMTRPPSFGYRLPPSPSPARRFMHHAPPFLGGDGAHRAAAAARPATSACRRPVQRRWARMKPRSSG
jgi:hypothetical protein